MSLSERIRPDCEAAPWVIEEVKRMESRIAALELSNVLALSKVQDIKETMWSIAEYLDSWGECLEEHEPEYQAYKQIMSVLSADIKAGIFSKNSCIKKG